MPDPYGGFGDCGVPSLRAASLAHDFPFFV